MVDSVFSKAYERVIEAVVAMRKDAGMTQRDLAAKLGREQSFIGRIETGQRRIDLVELIWLCKACGADPEAVLVKLVREVSRALPVRGRR